MKKTILKRIVSTILIMMLVLNMFPITALATTADTGYVYLTASYDGNFIEDKDGNKIAHVKVPISKLEKIDLEDYGLSQYLYDADEDGEYEVTALHLNIYIHETICGLEWEGVSVEGSPGSIYFNGGLFGYETANLRYDYNGSFPVDEKMSDLYGYTWGATADRIVLKDGDFIDVGSYSCWMFYGDSGTGFYHFADEAMNINHEFNVALGSDLNTKLIRSYSDWNSNGDAAKEATADFTVYYGKTLGSAYGSVITDSDGIANINLPEEGTWYLWSEGGRGIDEWNHYSCETYTYTGEMCIVSAPAYAKVIVETPANPDQEAADAVMEKINGIGTVTLDSENAINDARTAYDALTEEQKALVDNLDILSAAEAKLSQLKEEAAKKEADQAAADAVIAVINEIGTVTLESETAIKNVRDAYDALTEEQKALVTNTGVLTAAEAKLEQLKDDVAKAEANQMAADEVIAKIDGIGTVTLESETAIQSARNAYGALTEEQKVLVDNLTLLEEAETTLADLKAGKEAADKDAAEAVDALITDIKDVTAFSNLKIKKARQAYDALTEAQKGYVQNTGKLIAAEETLKDIYDEASKVDFRKIYEKTADYLSNLGTPIVGSTGGEWMVIALTRSGEACPEGYYENVEKFVTENINDKEQLHRAKSTENSRVILGLTSAGYDVTDVAGHNLLMGLTDMSYLKIQGINGPIWALIAFDSYDYEIPVNENARDQVTREKIINHILDNQLDNGGWALTGQGYDPDITGMAIQALAPYYDTNDKVKEAVDEALEMLSSIQSDNGGFSGVQDGISSESCVQVAVALTALGIDPEEDERFIKNGMSVIDAICLFAIEDGGFAHVPFGGLNGMATEQGQYALVSYLRLLNNQTDLYDMTDVTMSEDDDSSNTNDSDDTNKEDGITNDSGESNKEDGATNDSDNTNKEEGITNDSDETNKEDNILNDDETPQTGDDNNILMWVVVMALAVIGLVGLRKEN